MSLCKYCKKSDEVWVEPTPENGLHCARYVCGTKGCVGNVSHDLSKIGIRQPKQPLHIMAKQKAKLTEADVAAAKTAVQKQLAYKKGDQVVIKQDRNIITDILSDNLGEQKPVAGIPSKFALSYLHDGQKVRVRVASPHRPGWSFWEDAVLRLERRKKPMPVKSRHMSNKPDWEAGSIQWITAVGNFECAEFRQSDYQSAGIFDNGEGWRLEIAGLIDVPVTMQQVKEATALIASADQTGSETLITLERLHSELHVIRNEAARLLRLQNGILTLLEETIRSLKG